MLLINNLRGTVAFLPPCSIIPRRILGILETSAAWRFRVRNRRKHSCTVAVFKVSLAPCAPAFRSLREQEEADMPMEIRAGAGFLREAENQM